MPLLAQDTDARDVGRSADGRQVAAERRAAEQPVVHDFRVDAEIHGDDGYDGEHGGRVGDIVNERRENNRHPDYNGVDDEHAARAAADLRYRVADYINNARVLYAAYDDEKTGQQEDGVVIYLLECIFDKLCVLAEQLADYADKEEEHADKTVGYLGLVELTLGRVALVGDERNGDEADNSRNKQEGRELVLNLGALVYMYFVILLAEHEEDYQRAKGFHAKRTEKIPGVGVNLDCFAPNNDVRKQWREKLELSPNDTLLLTVGELTPRKNQHVMIKAVKLLQNSNVKLFVCGCGKLELQLKNTVKMLNLEEQVKLLGYRKDIPQLCCAADAFVFTSIQEGLPRALLEAMADGKAIVCSNIRGNVDLVKDGKGGLVVRNDAESVAAALKELIENQRLREEMGAYNMKAAEMFKEENSLKKVCMLLQDL